MIKRLWVQFPLDAILDFFCSSLCKDLSDNLTETPIVKNSNYLLMSQVSKVPNKRKVKFSDRTYCGNPSKTNSIESTIQCNFLIPLPKCAYHIYSNSFRCTLFFLIDFKDKYVIWMLSFEQKQLSESFKLISNTSRPISCLIDGLLYCNDSI